MMRIRPLPSACGGVLLCLACCLVLSDRSASAEEPQFLGRTRKDWVAELDAAASRRRRTHAAWALAEMAVLQSRQSDTMIWLNELLLLCEDENPTVRYWGIAGVRRFVTPLPADHPAREASLKMLRDGLSDASLAVRIAAAESLARLGPVEEALPVLIDSLHNPQDSVRIQEIDALARLEPTAQPAQAAFQAAESDSSEYVKRIAARALANLSQKP